MLFWLATLALITLASLILTLRSMRKFSDPAASLTPQSLFLVRNGGEFNEQVLISLHNLAGAETVTFSLERLFKGAEQALVIYGPMQLPELLPELDLLELEDYLTRDDPPSKFQTGLTQILGFNIPLTADLGFIRSSFLGNLELQPEEKFYWQLVLSPIPITDEDREKGDPTPHFELAIRCLIVAATAQERVDLAKKILPNLQEDFFSSTGQIKPLPPQNASAIFPPYVTRVLGDDQKSGVYITSQEILALLNLG